MWTCRCPSHLHDHRGGIRKRVSDSQECFITMFVQLLKKSLSPVIPPRKDSSFQMSCVEYLPRNVLVNFRNYSAEKISNLQIKILFFSSRETTCLHITKTITCISSSPNCWYVKLLPKRNYTVEFLLLERKTYFIYIELPDTRYCCHKE